MRLGELRAQIRAMKGNPVVATDFGLLVAVQKASLLQALAGTFTEGKAQETGLVFDGDRILSVNAGDELDAEVASTAPGLDPFAEDEVEPAAPTFYYAHPESGCTWSTHQAPEVMDGVEKISETEHRELVARGWSKETPVLEPADDEDPFADL